MKLFDKIYKCFVDVVDTTSNSVRVFHKKQTKKGIDCYQWYNINDRNYNDRFIKHD